MLLRETLDQSLGQPEHHPPAVQRRMLIPAAAYAVRPGAFPISPYAVETALTRGLNESLRPWRTAGWEAGDAGSEVYVALQKIFESSLQSDEKFDRKDKSRL